MRLSTLATKIAGKGGGKSTAGQTATSGLSLSKSGSLVKLIQISGGTKVVLGPIKYVAGSIISPCPTDLSREKIDTFIIK